MPKDTITTGDVLSAGGQSIVTLPGEAFLQESSMTRDGDDLVLTLKGGETVTVEGYFGMAEKPDLLSPKGGLLSPELVDSFLAPSHAGEYAQSATVANDASPAGQVADTVGDVFIIRADGTKLAAEKGMTIFQGDVVEADTDSAVNIVFADNSSFAVSEGARLSVDKYIYDAEQKSGSSFFSMLKGAFVYTSGMIGKNDPENVNIETPVGSIGIRGTVVAGVINEAGQLSEITVIDGAVVVSNGVDSYVLDEDFETLQLTGFDSAANNIGTVDADYMTQSYTFDNTISGFSFYDYAPPQDMQQDDPANDPGDNNEEGSVQPADGGTQTADTGTLSGDLLVQEMLQLQTYQQFQQQIGDEFIDQTGGAVLPADDGTALPDGTSAPVTVGTGGESLLDDGTVFDPTAPAGSGAAGAPITVTFSQWWDGSSMAGAGLVRELANTGFEVGQISVAAPAGGVGFAITGGNIGGLGGATFAIDAAGLITVLSEEETLGQSSYTLTVDVTDADSNVLPLVLNINIDDLQTGRTYVALGTGADAPSSTAAAELIWGNGGNDTFNIASSSPADIYLGGLGSDLFFVSTLNFTLLDGGYTAEGGTHASVFGLDPSLTGDSVEFIGVPMVLDLSSGGAEYTKFKGIENFIFTSNVGHAITLDTDGVLYATNQNATTLNIWGADGNTGTPYTVTLESFNDIGGGVYQSQSDASVFVNVIETVNNEVNVVLI